MDKQKFIRVLESVKAKLSDTSVSRESEFEQVQASMLQRVTALLQATVTADRNAEVVKAIHTYSDSINPKGALSHGDHNLLTRISTVVSEGLQLIKPDVTRLYPIITSCLFKISTTIQKYKNKEQKAQEKYVRELGAMLNPYTLMENRALMLASTANVLDIFNNMPDGFPEDLVQKVEGIKRGLKQFRKEISTGKTPMDALKVIGIGEMLTSSENPKLEITLTEVNAIIKTIPDLTSSNVDPFPASFAYMCDMAEIIQNYDGVFKEYFHSIGKAMIVIDTGKVRLVSVIDKLIAKFEKPPDGIDEGSEKLLKYFEDGLRKFKEDSVNNYNAAVDEDRKQVEKMHTLLKYVPHNQLVKTILSIFELLESSKTPDGDPLQMLRFMTAFGAILDTYDGEYSEFIREIGQIFAFNGVEECATTSERFHLEWQAIHRITSILHLMQ